MRIAQLKRYAEEQDPENPETPYVPKPKPGESGHQLSFPITPEPEEPEYSCAEYNCTFVSPDKSLFFYFPDDEEFYCKKHAGKCENCDEIVKDDDARQSPDGDRLCESCFEGSYMVCPNCDETIDNDNYLSPSPRRGGRVPRGLQDGGCVKCCTSCNACSGIIDKDSSYDVDGDTYCEDCYSDNFTVCDECNETVHNDNSHYDENREASLCDYCWTHSHECKECGTRGQDMIELEDSDEYICKKCFKGKQATEPFTKSFPAFSYSKKSRFLQQVSKLVPIDVRTLKTKHPALASGLQDLITFSGGKPINEHVLNDYAASLKPEVYPVEYSVWTGMQRSTAQSQKYNQPQLVLKIDASKEMLERMAQDPPLNDLFAKINELSKQSGHPSTPTQLGWSRIQLHSEEKYILIDEIQCDHSNALFRIKNEKTDDANQIRQALINKYKLDIDGFLGLLQRYAAMIKDFPDIANVAITEFARKNGFTKIYSHEYESGKKLKSNNPPKSIYTQTPKEHFYELGKERPFDLEGDFFQREAYETWKLVRLANKLDELGYITIASAIDTILKKSS